MKLLPNNVPQTVRSEKVGKNKIVFIYYYHHYYQQDKTHSFPLQFLILFIITAYFSFENDSFEGIKNNPRLLTAIQLSMINQKETLERTMETGEDTRLYQCTSCKVSAEEEDGEHPCSHCGRIMEV